MINIKITNFELAMLSLALTSSDYFHCDNLLEQGLTKEEGKAMISAFKKVGLTLSMDLIDDHEKGAS